MALLDWFRGPAERVDVGEVEVVRRRPDGGVERIAWDDLTTVRVVTTSEGPLAEDLFICLEAADGSGCVVPNALAAPLVGYLTRLPGFDADTFLQAFGSTGDAQFLCWTRSR